MDLRVLGCHGGETPTHRCPAFLVDSSLCLDAGAICRSLTIEQQAALQTVVVSHPHMDHVRDLALLADTRLQLGAPPLTIASTPGTIKVLAEHFFNNELWPDFSRIPTPSMPAIRLLNLQPEQETQLGQFKVRPFLVSHSIEAAGFVVSNGQTAIAYSGDTGPTDRMWEVLAQYPDLAALIIEVSFPNSQQALAHHSAHHTPQTLWADLGKLPHELQNLPIMLFHIKPVFQAETERDIERLGAKNLTVLQLGDEFVL